MPTCSRSSQTVRPTRGMITGPASSGDRTQRRTALLATAALCAFLITAALVLLRALPHRTAVEPLSVSPDRLSLSERTSPLFFSSRAAAPQAADSSFDPNAGPSGSVPLPPAASPDSSSPEGRRIAELVSFYGAASHPADRASLAGELAGVNSPEAVRQLLSLFAAETDPLARRDLLGALAAAEARQAAGADLARALQTFYALSGDPQERKLMLEVLSEAPTPEGVAFLRAQAAREEIDPLERRSACESLVRVGALAPELFGDDEVQVLRERLRTDTQSAESLRPADGSDHETGTRLLLTRLGP